jgi:hypothetical protein
MIRVLLVLLLGCSGTANATDGEEAPSASPSESLRLRFPEIQSDETEETFINRKDGDRSLFGSARRITYANRWNSIDRFPFSFEFRDDSLVLLRLHPLYNKVRTIRPKLPDDPPVGEPK